MRTFDDEKQNTHVKELQQKEEEESAKILSTRYGVKYIDLSGISISSDALRLINEAEAQAHEVAAFKLIGKRILVGVRAPKSPQAIESLDKLKEAGYLPEVYMVSLQSLQKAWDRYKDISFAMESKSGTLDISNNEIQDFLSKVESIADIKKLISENITEKKVYRVSKILAIIVAGSLSTKASDIHVEPEESYCVLRYRLDGVLIDVLHFDKETYNLLLSRIKLLSGLKLNIKENSQDGRFSIKIYDDNIEVRTSTLPGAYGESIVLRILNPKSIAMPLEELGIPPKLLSIFFREINKPNGMILTTGPTGSGKTTTLYAFLKRVSTTENKIITIEDPIEYHLPGIVQTQVDQEKGYTFASGLRSTLRQDPDVIMVGEIRDNETAEIAIHAALTGHLVFSTLHTNNAAGAFPRLIDLGINPKILTSGINVAIAQRLLRRLCSHCKKEVAIPEKLKEVIAIIKEKIKIKGEVIPEKDTWHIASGCEACNNTGYKGRIGIYEAILIDNKVAEVVTMNPSDKEVAEAATAQNILSLGQDGIKKVFEGMTSFEELERVVDLSFELPDGFGYFPDMH